LWRRPRPR